LTEKIVQLLNGDEPRGAVQQAIADQDDQVTKFVSLLIKEEEKQHESDDGKKGKDNIVITDTACK
jgi:hypothetical protein